MQCKGIPLFCQNLAQCIVHTLCKKCKGKHLENSATTYVAWCLTAIKSVTW